MKTKYIVPQIFRHVALVGLLAAAMALSAPGMVLAQGGGPSSERYLLTLERIPGEALVKLPHVIFDLNSMSEDSAALKSFFEDPRAYLLEKEDIDLPASEFKITALNLRPALLSEEPVMALSRPPIAKFVSNYAAIGLAYENAALFIKEMIPRAAQETAAVTKTEEVAPGFSAPKDEAGGIREILSLVLGFPEEPLNALPDLMREANLDGDLREDLLNEPRQTALEFGIKIPFPAYMMVVFDFAAAREQEEKLFAISPIEEGQATNPEGLCFMLNHIALLVQAVSA